MLGRAGITDGVKLEIRPRFSYMGCFVDRDGVLLACGDCTYEQAEEVCKMLAPGEYIVTLPQYNLHDVRDGRMPMDVIFKSSRYVITSEGVKHLSSGNRNPSLYQPGAVPEGGPCVGEKRYEGIWQVTLEQMLAEPAEPAELAEPMEVNDRQLVEAVA